MAIRLVHQPIGILGLSAYAAARGRQRKYPTGAPGGRAGRAGALPQGRFVNPLAALAAPAADAPVELKAGLAEDGRFLTPAAREREAEAERRRNLITQRAQFQAAARAGRMGRKYQGNLLPYFVPQEEIDRQRELADEERDRAFVRERDEAGRKHALERDEAGFARDDMLARRRAVEREAGSLKIPDWVSPRDRIELEKRKAAVGEFARPDVDLTDPAAAEAYAGATDSFSEYLEGLKPPDPNEGGLVIGEDGRFRAPLPGERADYWNAGPGQPPVALEQPKDLAAEQAAKQAAADLEYENKRYDYWISQEVDDERLTPETAADKARQDAEQMRRRRTQQLNRNAPVKAPGAFLGAPESPAPAAQTPVPQQAPPELAALEAMAQLNQQAQPATPQPSPYAPKLTFDEAMSQLNQGALMEAAEQAFPDLAGQAFQQQAQQPAAQQPIAQPPLPAAEFDEAWAKAKPGDIVRGPDGKLYTKKGR